MNQTPESFAQPDQEAFQQLIMEKPNGRIIKQGRLSDHPSDSNTTLRWTNDTREGAPIEPGFFMFREPCPNTYEFIPFHSAYIILSPLASTNKVAASLLARFPKNRLPKNAPRTPPTTDDEVGGPKIATQGALKPRHGAPMKKPSPTNQISSSGPIHIEETTELYEQVVERRRSKASPGQLSPILPPGTPLNKPTEVPDEDHPQSDER